MPNRNARIGLVLFAVYLAFYAAFVLIAAFSPATMERLPWAGVNLAVWYGFALIIAAFVLAILYGALCRTSPDERASRGVSAPGESNFKSEISNQKS
jgi:uncharacterized membrane protein (DUF485 family)